MKVCLNGPPVILRGVDDHAREIDNNIYSTLPTSSPPSYSTQWVTPGPAPIMDSLCHPFSNSSSVLLPSANSATWDARPKELRISNINSATLPLSSSSSTSSSLQKTQERSMDIELNGLAIKERLMASRLPESCV